MMTAAELDAADPLAAPRTLFLRDPEVVPSLDGNSLGRPLTACFEEDVAAGAAWRRFERGTVAILSGPKSFAIPGTGLVLPTPEMGYLFPSRR